MKSLGAQSGFILLLALFGVLPQKKSKKSELELLWPLITILESAGDIQAL